MRDLSIIYFQESGSEEEEEDNPEELERKLREKALMSMKNKAAVSNYSPQCII